MNLQPRASALSTSPLRYVALHAPAINHTDAATAMRHRRDAHVKCDMAHDAPPFAAIFLGPDVPHRRPLPATVASSGGRYCLFLPVHKKDAPAFALFVDEVTERFMQNGHAYNIQYADNVLCDVAPLGTKWRVQPLRISYNPRTNEMRIHPRRRGGKVMTVARPAEAKSTLQALQPGLEWVGGESSGWQSPSVALTEVVLPSVMVNGNGAPIVMGLPRPLYDGALSLV